MLGDAEARGFSGRVMLVLAGLQEVVSEQGRLRQALTLMKQVPDPDPTKNRSVPAPSPADIAASSWAIDYNCLTLTVVGGAAVQWPWCRCIPGLFGTTFLTGRASLQAQGMPRGPF